MTTTPHALDSDAAFDPLEMVESILNEEGLEFERTPEGDLGFALTGDWRTYEMWFSWRPEGECLQLCCSLNIQGGDDTVVGEARMAGLYELLSRINQHVWFGHFEVFRDAEARAVPDFDVIFRHTVALNALDRGTMTAGAHMINSAAEAVDRFFPAFDFWYRSGLSASDAFAACLFETKGEA